MNYQLLLPLLTTTGVAILGWLVGHALNARRDRQNKRREIRVQYLIEAYRRLETSTCRDSIYSGTEFGKGLESAIADIQLFGTEDQAQMAKKLAENIALQKNASANPLLISLRDTLRRELNLGTLNKELFQFRLKPKGQ